MMWKMTARMPFQNEDVVFRELPDGSIESCLISRPDVQEWIAQGNTPLPADE